MGNKLMETPSVQLAIPKNFQHFGIMFGYINRLRLVMASKEIADATNDVLTLHWTMQKAIAQPGFIEFELFNAPWYASASTDAAIKYVLCKLFEEFYALGWHLKVASGIQCFRNEPNSLIFEKGVNLKSYVICVSLNDCDKIRVLAPEELIAQVRTLIMSYWPKGMKSEKRIDKGFEFILCGCPWAERTSETYSTYLINGLLATFYHLGWIFIGAIKTGKHQYDLNSLYFRYEPSILQNIQQYGQNRFFTLSLNDNDKIRLINTTADIISLIRSTIPQYWSKGIKEEMIVQLAHELKLHGNPWWCNGKETVHSRRLISGILSALREFNWELYAVCELTADLNGKSVFFFRLNNQATLKPNRTVCVSLHEPDKIRIMDANKDEINGAINAILSNWPRYIEDQGFYGMSYQFTLSGYPFKSRGFDHIYGLATLIYLLANLQDQGLNLICSADVSGKYEDNSTALHSWFFAEN